MAIDTDLHDDVTHRLRLRGQRYTSTRRHLIEVIAQAGRPLTLPEIIGHAPDLAQSSAYRNLDVLEASGSVRRITTSGDHTHFELAEPLLDHHHHLICVDCGTIVDVHLDDELEHLVDQRLGAAARRAGFTPLHHSLDVHGRCTNCEQERH